MTMFVSDVSHHDYDRGPIDWTRVRAGGIEVVIAKATEGDPTGYHYIDSDFPVTVSQGRSAGMALVGGYHCLSHGNTSQQVDMFLQYINQNGGVAKGWWMIDVEPFPELESRGIAPVLDDVLAFEAAWHSKTGGWPLVHYIPRWYWERWGSPSLTSIAGPLIASNYPISATQPYATLYAHDGGDIGPGWAAYGGKTPKLWQYASSDAIPGITGNCDCSAFKGSLAQFDALVTKSATPTPPSHPVWPGRVFVNKAPQMHGDDIKTWQAQMAKRRWTITADGFYGPQSAQICAQFQAEKHITADHSGQVGKTTWDTSWTAPIT